jgi:hypothetical protein
LRWRGEVARDERIDLSASEQEEVRARARARLPHLEEQVEPSPSGYGEPRDVRLQVEAAAVAAVWRYEVGGLARPRSALSTSCCRIICNAVSSERPSRFPISTPACSG